MLFFEQKVTFPALNITLRTRAGQRVFARKIAISCATLLYHLVFFWFDVAFIWFSFCFSTHVIFCALLCPGQVNNKH